MNTHSGNQKIKQLEKRKGGYFYLELNADVVNQFENKKATRIICTLDNALSYRCGLNHLGDGNFFIIIATKYIEKLGKNLGDPVNYRIDKDPDQLGVDVPEVLEVFLAQDSDLKSIYEALTDGKKRSLIYSLKKTKNIDSQVQSIIEFLNKEKLKMK
ncbi:MAG: DUF1905 domain-containing protein [Phaeodactylibacter sp.]|nr:DUF1905 domain-containing protein [Phaeodactylibacter sp.]MCB9292161.1 DUF1905 domain-containing protein [Lewinellaceae bacterium]